MHLKLDGAFRRAALAPLLPFALATAATWLAPACKSSEETKTEETSRAHSAEISEQATVQAKVIAIDRAARSITLAREDGSTLVVVAGPQVGNFDLIAVGDHLRVRYLESLAVRLVDAKTSTTPAGTTITAGSAMPGQKPARGVGLRVDVTVRVESVDLEHDLVVVTPPDGMLRVLHVVRPEGKEFIQHLKPGDHVLITYSEALAVSIEE